MSKIVKLAIAAFLLSAGSVQAQECLDIAKVLGRDIARYASQDEIDQVNQANLCQSEYRYASNAQRAQIEAAYSLFSGRAEGSSDAIEEMQTQRCESQYGSYWSRKVLNTELITASQVGADVIKSCFATRTFHLTDLTIQEQAISATYVFGGSEQTIIDTVNVNPPEIADCKVAFDGKEISDLSTLSGSVVKPNANVTLNCTRTGVDAGEGQTVFDGGIIGIATRDGTAKIPLIRFGIPKVPTETADSLSNRISDLEAALQAQSVSQAQAVQALKDATNTGFAQLLAFRDNPSPAPGTRGGDMQDSAYGPGDPHHWNCGPAGVVVGFVNYIEDGHIKASIECVTLPSVSLP